MEGTVIKNNFFPLLVASLLMPLAVNTSLNLKEVSGAQPSYEELLLSTPYTLNDDFTYQEISRLDLNASEVTYFNIADYITKSITYGYGFEHKGIGNSFFLDTPGGGYDTLMRARTICDDDLSTSDGLMFFVDEVRAIVLAEAAGYNTDAESLFHFHLGLGDAVLIALLGVI